MKFYKSSAVLLYLCICAVVVTGFQFCIEMSVSPDESLTIKKLKSVADRVLEETKFSFKDKYSERHFSSTKDAPPDAELLPDSRYNDWRYWNGLLNIAMLRLGDVLNVSAYKEYASKNIAFAFNNYEYFQKRYKGEDKWSFPFAQLFIMEDLDDYGAMGASLIEVYETDKKDVYKSYIDKASNRIVNMQQRFKDGSFIRNFPRQWTLWADDLYMSISFLSSMGELTGDNRYFNDAALQVINFNNHLFDHDKRLMHHNWYSDNGEQGIAFWGRANGWALLAQIDLLERLPQNFLQRDTLLSLFRRHIAGILKYQDKNGLWHQLLDKNDSYEETSCTAMFIYSILRAVNKGLLDVKFKSAAVKGWKGLETKITKSGEIEGVCTGSSVSDDINYYYNRPAPLNDMHGIGVVLLAGSETLKTKN